MISEIPRMPRRGELDRPLQPHARRLLHDIYRELQDIYRRAGMIHDDFLALLIATAADEARDQLRDDLILRGEDGAADIGDAEIEE